MNKKAILSLVVILLISVNIQSQWFSTGVKGNGNIVTKTRNVGDYDKVSVAGSFDVTLVAGNEGSLSIKIEDNLLEYLITEVVNGSLKIKWEKGVNIRTRKGVYITVPFEEIEAVKLSGSGDITSDDVIKATDFYTSVSGSGDIKLNVEADEITSKVTGSGDVTLKGNSPFLKTSVTGSGDFHGFNLKTKKVEAKVTGSGDISVFVTENLNARVTGSGDIDYKGNPEIQNTRVTGSGDISPK